MKIPALFPAVLLALLADTTAVSAQSGDLAFPAASPPALVRETFGLTTVEIEYARPGVKGRRIFGGLVPYGEVWRTGANAATRVSFDTDVTVGGEDVAAGTYALFTIPGEDEWTVILNDVSGQWGSYAYDSSRDVVRVAVEPQVLHDPVETLHIGLEDLRDESARLVVSWDRTRVAVPVEADLVELLVPRIEAAMAGDAEPKPYLSAAMFYYEHDVDLDKALAWIDGALGQQPDAVWVVYRKGLILEKRGELEAARGEAERAIALADGVGGALGAEYRRLSEGLRDRLE